MKKIKMLCLAAAAVILSACGGSSVDLSKPEFAVGAYWESLAISDSEQFLNTIGDPKEGKALDEQSRIFFKNQFGKLSQKFNGNIKTILVTEVKYDEAKTSAKVKVLLERFDGSVSERRMLTVKNGDAWRLKGPQSGASGFEAIGEAFGEALGNFGKLLGE